ncbi:OmpA family protein [uncultured Hyphomicrobium sp.]|uniref:OmpA family protein n=1 Tax=uncultured Hyphomicrobium sp. TaxID=194373 RepID=UPI0025EC7BDD|nr:OmpA family protein [uncultured Hyphomicrobium sp.]
MRCNPSRWLWGLIPIAMLSWGTYYKERPHVEADLAVRATEALLKGGQPWAKVTLTGRDAVITGRAKKDGEPKAALDIVRGVWGIRTVQLKTDLAGAAAAPAGIGPQLTDEEKAARAAEKKAAEAAAAAAARKAEEEAAALKAKQDAEAALAAKAKAEADAVAAAAAQKAKDEADAAAAAAAQRAKDEAEAARKAEAEAAELKAKQEAEADAALKAKEAEGLAAQKAKEDSEAAAALRAKEEAEASQRAKEDAEAAAAQKAKQEADMAAEAKADAEAQARKAAEEQAAKRKTTAATAACEKRLAAAASEGVILFNRASADIDPKSSLTIARLAEIIKTCPGSRVEVEGHTDAEGTDERNQNLSERRARAVVNSLGLAGVDKDRLSSVGYGASRPVAPNDTREGMARNRRIEFKVFTN